MSEASMIALEKLDMQFGHETAHLTPLEQIEVAVSLSRRLGETIAEIAQEELS